MLKLLWLIPTLPMAGFAVLTLAGRRLSTRAGAVVGVMALGATAALALALAGEFLTAPPPDHAFSQTLWTWIHVGGFAPTITFRLDALSLVMVVVVAVVSFLIQLYSTAFMAGEEGYNRFLAYMSLFVGAMLVLVLAEDLLLLYLGWEGVGLCSYLLIGFWYRDAVNGRAARKAFVVTRVGDTAMAIGLFLLATQLGTLHIPELTARAVRDWPVGSALAVASAALLLGGAVGKSAQLPLQVWLPDAMAGPTPTSALIHAATMVTAGVYLIARMHALFELAPVVMAVVAAVGALTLLLAATAALTQRDLKHVLAYSTVSQIGYMFTALGVGAWSAAIFHFMTHAFFKSLLFLAAGVVILATHHEHDMFRMGGLRRRLPLVFWTFVIGAASLASLPLVTAGFYSKDLILWEQWAGRGGSGWLWAAGAVGAALTALYSFRMVFVTFFGVPQEAEPFRPGLRMSLPLVMLAGLAVVAGLINLPPFLGDWPAMERFLHSALPASQHRLEHGHGSGMLIQLAGIVLPLVGVAAAWLFYLRRPELAERLAAGPTGALGRFWRRGWGFDWLYDRLFVRPFLWVAHINRRDFIDLFYDGVAAVSRAGHAGLRDTQTGRLRWYAVGIAAGAVVAIAIVVLL